LKIFTGEEFHPKVRNVISSIRRAFHSSASEEKNAGPDNETACHKEFFGAPTED
jgi:hypothetical protein